MLVEINLLPQKEPKKTGFIVSLSCLVALLLMVGSYYLWQTNSTKSDIASLDRQITMTKRIADKENKSTQTVEATSSVSQLKSAIDWAKDYPIQTIPVMRHLTSLLPERGFIQNFAYTEAGTVSLTVQFDSAREAAYFLDNLNESKWIEEASLNSLSTAATVESASETKGASTSQTNTTIASTDSSTQTNQADTNQNSTDQSSTPKSSNQPNSTSGQTNEQSSTVITNTNAVKNSPTASSSTPSKTVGENILPRYTGQFEIQLNKEVVKENIKKSKKNEEGVTGS